MKEIQNCLKCGKPDWIQYIEGTNKYSSCTGEHKRVYCDKCKHPFLAKDIAIHNGHETICKCCYEATPYLLDTLSVRYFKPSEKPHVMMCVEKIDNKLQLSIQAYGMGMSVKFPAMSKQDLIHNWLGDSTVWNNKDISLLFGSAILRIIPDYINREELKTIRTDWVQQQMAQQQIKF